MPLVSGLAEFRREAQGVVHAMRRDAAGRLKQLGEHAFSRIVENTERVGAVDTGAYRAEHVIERDGSFLYEHPERPGDTVLPSRKRAGLPPLIGPPDKREVSDALEQGNPLRGFSFVNRRFVADWLENGTSRMEPRRIYATSAADTASFAEVVARAPSLEPELSRSR